MKIIDTSVITSLAGYPGLANVNGVSIGTGGNPDAMQGLDFLQQANKDNANALSLSLVSDATKASILSGCGVTGTNDIASGWVFYNGEIYQVTGNNLGSAPMGMPNIMAIVNASPTDASPNPVTTLSDGSTVSIHNQRIITFSWSATSHITGGTGYLPDFAFWIKTQVAQNVADIATNTADIATNTADIATNTTDIATNTADIATNTTDIATNTSAIATNTAAITTINTEMTGIDSDLSTLTADVATINSELATHTTDISTINSEIATINGEITALEVAPVVLKNSSSGTSVSSSSWTMLTQVTTPNDGITRTWKMDFRGYLQTLGNYITEDVNVKFTNVTTSTDYDSTSTGKVSCGSISYSDAIKDFVGLFTAVLMDVQTIGPGALLEVQANTTAGTAVGSMEGCTMVLVEIK